MRISINDGKRNEAIKRALLVIMRLSLIGPAAWFAFLLWLVSRDGNMPVPPRTGTIMMLCFYGGLALTNVSLVVLGVSLVWYAVLWLSERFKSDPLDVGMMAEKRATNFTQHENVKRALVIIMRLSVIGPAAWLAFLVWFVSMDGNTPMPSEMGVMLMLCFYGGLLVTVMSLIVLGVSLLLYAVLWLSERQTAVDFEQSEESVQLLIVDGHANAGRH